MSRLPLLLLPAGAGIVAALGYLLLESWRMEERLRAAGRDQAHAVAERLLQRAPASRPAFDALPSELRAVVGPDGAVDAAAVGWSMPASSPLDRDPVVEDRLARAARAEFTDHDSAAAERQFDELLAGPMMDTMRLQVVHAAAWQALRAGERDRLARLRDELDRRLADVRPADLARPVIANVVAGALRLAGDAPTEPASSLAPFLPPDRFAALPAREGWAERHAEIVARRAFLGAVQDAVDRRAPTGSAVAPGLEIVDGERLLWTFARPDGGLDAALVSPADWCGAVTAASLAGSLPELPAPFTLASAPTTAVQFGGVPGVAGVVDMATNREPVWLRPLLTGILLSFLLVAFGVAVFWQLRAARREVRAVRTQAQFLTTVTHELKTPLAGIHLLGEMLAEGRAKGREAEYYRLLVGEAGRLAMLIDNVLDLGRLERGERGVVPRPVDVGEVVGETLAMFAPVAERDGLAVRLRGVGPGLVARVDRAAFVQALVAVLDNARKYGAAGGVLEIDVARAAHAVQVTVRDRGPGVPAAERERVFERFVRGDAHRHGSTPGVGIGLFLARSLMRRQRCDLMLAPTADGGPGAAFVFQLPMEDAA